MAQSKLIMSELKNKELSHRDAINEVLATLSKCLKNFAQAS